MLFSEYYKISNARQEDWFDPVLEADTKLFIDPMLVFQNEMDGFENSKKKIQEFFQQVFERIALAKGKGLYVKERELALSMLRFKEPKELGLGYTNFGSQGSGMGPQFASEIYNAVINFLEMGLEEFYPYLSTFELFVEGIGPDRISDMIANLIKEDLVKYTQNVCKENKIPTKSVLIENLGFKNGMWVRNKINLPVNPFTKKPIILVPKYFLRADSYLELEDLESYLCHIENVELRNQATKLFTSDLNRHKLIEALKQDPETVKKILREYIKARIKEKASPYDFSNDPELLYWFKDKLNKILEELPKINVIEKTKESLVEFVEKVIAQFKKCVESNEGYSLLFNDDKSPRGERAAQIFFGGIADTLCKENDIDVSPESKTGRGPVDFKFSRGYAKRILVEIKLAKNAQIYHGLEKQLPTYLESDEIDLGYYVIIKQLGGDNARVIRLEDRYKQIGEDIKKKIKIRVIDAYVETKTSASKVR